MIYREKERKKERCSIYECAELVTAENEHGELLQHKAASVV